jgi:hypothetical protein
LKNIETPGKNPVQGQLGGSPRWGGTVRERPASLGFLLNEGRFSVCKPQWGIDIGNGKRLNQIVIFDVFQKLDGFFLYKGRIVNSLPWISLLSERAGKSSEQELKLSERVLKSSEQEPKSSEHIRDSGLPHVCPLDPDQGIPFLFWCMRPSISMFWETMFMPFAKDKSP